MIWRVTGSLSPRRQNPIAEAVTMAPHAGVSGPGPDPESATALRRERDGLVFIGGTLLLISLALSLGLKAISQILSTREEHYHAVADIFVVMSLGLVIGGLWRSKPLRGRAWSGHVLSALALASLVAVGLGHLPPYTSPDGGWPAAQAAAARIEGVAAGGDVGFVSLPFFRQSDAYGYPLKLDGVKLVSPDEAATVVLLCDADWYPGCGGPFEELWRLGAADGATLKLVDRFEAAPQRILSVYRRLP